MHPYLAGQLRQATTLLLVLLAVVPIAQARDYTETFNDDVPPALPTSDWYDYAFSGIGQGRTTTTVAVHQVAMVIEDTDAAVVAQAQFDVGKVGINFCRGSTMASGITFAFRLDSIGATSDVLVNIQSLIGGGVLGARLRINNAGGLRVESDSTAGSVFATIAQDVWYNMTLALTSSCANGGTAIATAYVKELDVSSSVTDVAFACPTTCVQEFVTFTTGSASDTARFYIDNLVASNVNDPPPVAIGSAATVSVTSLIGFSISQEGSTAIARTSTQVESFSGGPLVQLDTEPTDCGGTFERISAIPEFVTFLDCTGGDVKQLKIRAPQDLQGTPDFSEAGSGCDNSAVCPATINLEDTCVIAAGSNGLSIENVLKHIKSTDFAPTNYSYVTDVRDASADSRALAMSFTTNDGRAGVFAFTAVDNDCDEFRIAAHNTGTSGDIDDLCTWVRPNGQTVFGVADESIAPRIMSVGFSLIDSTADNVLEPTLGSAVTYSTYSGAESLGCAQNKLLFGLDNRAVLYNLQNDTVIWDKTHTGDGTNGARLSQDGEWAIVRTSPSLVTLYAASNGTAMASFAIPSGTYHDSFIGAAGASVWIGTSGSPGVLARFAIGSVTGSTCDQLTCTGVGDPAAPATTGGIFAGQGAVVGASLGIGAFGGNTFLGVLLIGMVSVGIGTATKSIPIAMIGAVVGFLLGWAFGFFSTAVVFAVVIIVGVLGWLLMRGRGGG